MRVSKLEKTPSFREFVSLFPEDCTDRALEYLFLKSEKVSDLSSYCQLRESNIDFESSVDKKLVERLSDQSLPVSRLTESVFFNNKKLRLAQGVFIPRVETEELVRETIRGIEKLSLSSFSYLDLCCGSGNIFLELLEEFQTRISSSVAVDFSLVACRNTLLNLQLRGLKNQSEVYLSNGTNFLKKDSTGEVITINPPYLGEEELKTPEDSLRKYDPKWALEGGELGFSHYRRILDFARENPFGRLILLECSEFHEEKGRKVTPELSFNVEVYRDYLGKFRGVILNR